MPCPCGWIVRSWTRRAAPLHDVGCLYGLNGATRARRAVPLRVDRVFLGTASLEKWEIFFGGPFFFKPCDRICHTRLLGWISRTIIDNPDQGGEYVPLCYFVSRL